MENFVGDTNRRCNAKILFAESVSQNLKLQAAVRMFPIARDLSVPFLDEQESDMSGSLCFFPSDPHYDGFSFRHPKLVVRIKEASRRLDVDLLMLLQAHYERNGLLEPGTSAQVIGEDNDVVLWGRMVDEKTDSLRQTVYKGFLNSDGDDQRLSCFFAAYFSGSNHTLDVYYGRAHVFIQHTLMGKTHMLVLSSWADKVLNVGMHRQVYANFPTNSSRLFSNTRIDAVTCLSYQIMLLEAKKKVSKNRTVTRTYFIDELREKNSLLSDQNDDVLDGGERKILKGFRMNKTRKVKRGRRQ